MTPSGLAGPLAERRSAVLGFLRAATALDQPRLAELIAAGIPRWDADAWLRRLYHAGEMPGGTWAAEARTAYRALLAEADATGDGALARLPEQERPRERALRGDIAELDDAELVALLLRTGSGDEDVIELAQRLLHEHGGLVGMARLGTGELTEARGLGPAKAAELAAAFELGRRLSTAALRERPQLKAPEQAAALVAPLMAALGHEEFWCLPLDARLHLLGEPRVVSQGDVDSTDAPPRAFYRLALRAGAVSAIAVHNHPSGDPAPSAADRELTRSLVAAGRTVGVALNDHLIIGDGGRYVSLRREHPELFR
jgi:DNA repair protein RadC